MYNRYLSGEKEPFVPVWEQSSSHTGETTPPHRDQADKNPPPPHPHAPPGGGNAGSSPMDRIQQLLGFGGKKSGSDETLLRRLLARFHLEDVDTGDLMLLILLFFLLEEKADDELLIALGILLIL